MRAEQAGTVRHGDAEGGDPLVALQRAHHDGGQQPRIDVAAAQDEADLQSAEAIGKGEHGGEAGRPGAFGHGAGERGVGSSRRSRSPASSTSRISSTRSRTMGSVKLADRLDRDAFGQRRPADGAVLGRGWR